MGSGQTVARLLRPLDTVLDRYPPPSSTTAADVRRAEQDNPHFTVVLDDDPTGTQSVRDVPILTRWTVEDFEWVLEAGATATYVLTNTRGFNEADAKAIVLDVARNALAAAAAHGRKIRFVTRGDSTLRGHFPAEPDTLTELLHSQHPDASGSLVLLVPAFPQAGRVTIESEHFLLTSDGLLQPIAETEFAADATFGYESSNLRDYVQEKTAGRVRSDDVLPVLLGALRNGNATEALMSAPAGGYSVADAASEHDLLALARAAIEAELRGRSIVYRSGPPFVRALLGQDVSPPLDRVHTLATDVGGLIVVGSHTGITTRQLDQLKRAYPATAVHEIAVPQGQTALDQTTLAEAIISDLRNGNVIVQTSRSLVSSPDRDESLAIAQSVSDAITTLIRTVVDRVTPKFVLSKGGITSSDIATRALRIQRANIEGCLFPGIVSVWRPVPGSRYEGPYVVFPGNVGDEESLAAAVAKFE